MKKIVFLLMFLFCFQMVNGQAKYNHILITNDDGIGDADRLLALAKGVKDTANRISIIVSAFDRSGTSNHTLYGKYQSSFEVTCVYLDKEDNIAAYIMPANPADCVLLGLGGFFGDDRPDLVLSGINSGPNIGPGWFGSGTIGAARVSAFLSVKAIAFSGFDDDKKESFSVIPKWIRDFISSDFVDGMGNHSYLTIAFPRIPFEEIKGVKLAERRISYDRPEMIGLKKIYGEGPHVPENKTIWAVEITGNPNNQGMRYDDDLLEQGFIIITPMNIDENDEVLMDKLKAKTDLIPKFYK